jgi:predicted metal-binding protein
MWLTPVSLPTEELIGRYYRPEHLAPFCAQCENFGQNYACPPTGTDMLALLRSYDRVRLYAARLMMPPTLARAEACAFFERGMVAFNREVLSCEAQEQGSLAVFPGKCVSCARCARRDGLPCRDPGRMRFSLDAFLLEIAQMSAELFHIEIHWYNDKAPPYLTMMGGLLLPQATVGC